MHPTTRYQLATAQTADLHQRAARERAARAAIQGRANHRRARQVPGHAVTTVARVLALAGGHRLSPARAHAVRRRAVPPGRPPAAPNATAPRS